MTTRQSLAPRRREPQGLGRLAWALCVAAEGMAAACVVLLLAGHVSVGDAVNAYLVTNLGMVVTFAAIGGLVAGNRPQNPIGWPQRLLRGGDPGWDDRGRPAGRPPRRQPAYPLIVFQGTWPLGIGIALPLAVELFPTGRPLSPRWRWLIGLTVISGLAFDAQTLLDPVALAVTDRPVPRWSVRPPSMPPIRCGRWRRRYW
jgi:two-component system, NarL family, sensor kinase